MERPPVYTDGARLCAESGKIRYYNGSWISDQETMISGAPDITSCRMILFRSAGSCAAMYLLSPG